MNLVINRLDPNVPDPVESRRRAAGRLVRFVYAAIVFGILGFFVVYFGRPLVFLSGPGVVLSARVVVSLPYVVQVQHMSLMRGQAVKAGEEIGRISSPQQDALIGTYMRSLTEIAARSAELRIKLRVARESLEPARMYLHVTEEAVERVENSSAASTVFRVEVFRERASARKAVVSLEAEVAEATTQLSGLDDLDQKVRQRLSDAERNFAEGRIFSPIDGIVPTTPAHRGESLAAGSPIAVIQDPRDVFIAWYIPNERFADPAVGREVSVLFGRWRFYGTITEILPVSEVHGDSQAPVMRERVATQIARVRLAPGSEMPALNSTVYVRMYYTDFARGIAGLLVRFFGFRV